MFIDRVIVDFGHTVTSVPPETTIAEVASILAANKFSLVAVCDGDNRFIGVLFERDIVRAISLHGAAALEMKTEEFVTREVETCKPSDHTHEGLRRMNERQISHMPVVEDGILKGLVNRHEINIYLARQRLAP